MSNVEISLRKCEEECNINPSLKNTEKCDILKEEYNSLYEHLSKFELMSIADALPLNWCQSIKGNNNFSNTAVLFYLQSQIGLYIMGNKVIISKVPSKSISHQYLLW